MCVQHCSSHPRCTGKQRNMQHCSSGHANIALFDKKAKVWVLRNRHQRFLGKWQYVLLWRPEMWRGAMHTRFGTVTAFNILVVALLPSSQTLLLSASHSAAKNSRGLKAWACHLALLHKSSHLRRILYHKYIQGPRPRPICKL